MFWFNGLKMYFSLFKFVDSWLFTANLVSSLNCYWIISDCKQVEMLYKQGCEIWNCSSVWVAIFKVTSKWSVHWGGKLEQIFTSVKMLFSWNTFGQACVEFPCTGCLWRLCWPWSVPVCLSSLLGPVWWHVCDRGQRVAPSVLFQCLRHWRRERECQVCRMGELIKKQTTCQTNNKEITL